MGVNMSTDIRALKGVGEKRARSYQKLDISTIRDLLYHVPRSYIDLSSPVTVEDAVHGETSALRVRIMNKGTEQRIRGSLSLTKVLAADDTGSITLIFFNARYTVDALSEEKEYIVYGRIGGSLTQKEMPAPAVYPVDSPDRFIPIYPLTAGISSKMIATNVRQALKELSGRMDDIVPAPIRDALGLESVSQALLDVHFCPDMETAKAARRRLAFEELFVLSVALTSMKQAGRGHAFAVPENDLAAFYGSLPFKPTNAQLRCISECLSDLRSSVPMNRLLQGDVGSGKTLVAAACACFVKAGGAQSAMMAPTELLTLQHYDTLRALTEPFGLRTELLTGSMRAAEKKRVKEALLTGEADLCVGTHALLTEDVLWNRLALVITDEQHRFGVSQRMALAKKAQSPHMLVMSATPIPRTLAMILYGDLDISVIDELPPGRKKIETYAVSGRKRERALGFVKKQLEAGRQAYIVCPLVEYSQAVSELRDATRYAQELSNGMFCGCSIGLLHGRMSAAEKESMMSRFKSGEVQLLVSTTVIEVGVDVPNATVMLVENAERFGLSQLHQLRGRVGRGEHASYCILISDARSEDAVNRLKAMCASGDGFELSEQDLAIRGPGDFFGNRQHGMPAMKIADLTGDAQLFRQASDAAKAVLADDPALEKWENSALKLRVKQMRAFLC